MLKNLVIFPIAADWAPDADALLAALEQDAFAHCGKTQARSVGWVPPRGEPGADLLESIDGEWLLSLRAEKRVLPASVVREHVDFLAEKVELETGRRPGRKQRADLKEQATLELLPQAFTVTSHVRVWLSPKLRMLMIDAPSISRADEVVTALVKCDPTLRLHLLQTSQSPVGCMEAWLRDGVPPEHFVIDGDCELKSSGERRAAVRFTRDRLDLDVVGPHLGDKEPTRLALTWKERVSFTMTDVVTLKGIKFLDVVFDGRDKPAKDEAFDVDAALATGELSQLIPQLIEGLGGLLDFAGQSAKIAAEHAPAGAQA